MKMAEYKMKTKQQKFKLSVLALAAMGLMSSYVYADDEEVAALKNPTNSIEIGGVSASGGTNNKYGEYTGITRDGQYLNGGFDVRGGTAYGKEGEEGGTYRWYFKGSDLGLTSRSASAGASDQGSWDLKFNYDALTHSTTTGYQTPFTGVMGGNSWTLPNGTLATNANPGLGLAGVSATKYSPMDVSNTRQNLTINGNYIINSGMDLTFEYNHLIQTGAKLQGFGTQTGYGNTAGNTAVANGVAIIPVPTNSTTDTINLSANWKGSDYRYSLAYNGSFFRNGYSSVNIDPFYASAAGTYATQTLSLAPSNDFHQLSLSGGYDFSSKQKMTANFSMSTNTQNSPFVNTDVYIGTPPSTSMNGLVNTTHADIKYVDQTTKDLTLNAQVKYDERDNLTQAQTYSFASLDGGGSSGLSHIADYSNTPLSTRKELIQLSADYKIDKTQAAGVTYAYENIHRWCNQYAPSYFVTAAAPSGVTAANLINQSVNANCVLVPTSQENKLDTFYKVKFTDDFNLRFGYSYAHRIVDVDQNAYAAFLASATPGSNTSSSGLNGGSYIGFVPGFEASRVEQTAKVSSNMQLTDELSLTIGGKYTYQGYDANIYGLQSGDVWSANVDLAYAYSEDGVASAYLTRQHRDRYTSSYNVNYLWGNVLNDDDITVGFGFKQKDLMSGRLTLTGDLTYSFAASNYATMFSNAASSQTICSSAGGTSGSCSLPDIKTEMLRLKLNGTYQVDKHSKVSLMYMFTHLDSNDWYYSALAIGANPYSLTNGPSSVVPDGQVSGTYNIHLLGVSYIYNF